MGASSFYYFMLFLPSASSVRVGENASISLGLAFGSWSLFCAPPKAFGMPYSHTDIDVVCVYKYLYTYKQVLMTMHEPRVRDIPGRVGSG